MSEVEDEQLRELQLSSGGWRAEQVAVYVGRSCKSVERAFDAWETVWLLGSLLRFFVCFRVHAVLDF